VFDSRRQALSESRKVSAIELTMVIIMTRLQAAGTPWLWIDPLVWCGSPVLIYPINEPPLQYYRATKTSAGTGAGWKGRGPRRHTREYSGGRQSYSGSDQTRGCRWVGRLMASKLSLFCSLRAWWSLHAEHWCTKCPDDFDDLRYMCYKMGTDRPHQSLAAIWQGFDWQRIWAMHALVDSF